MQTPVTERFGHVVSAVEAEILADLMAVDSRIDGINYLYGHPIAIIKKLATMEKLQATQALKFPLVALLQDFPERMSKGIVTARVTILVVTRTKADLTTPERYANNIKPILYPIVEGIERHLVKSAWFYNATVDCDKVDHPFYGKDGLYGPYSDIATDLLDAVSMRNLSLNVPAASCRPYALKNF